MGDKVDLNGKSFSLIGYNSEDVPRFIGSVDTHEQAEELRTSAEIIGWRRVTVYDAALKAVDVPRRKTR